MKKSILFLGVLVLLVMLVGCASNGDSSSVNEEESKWASQNEDNPLVDTDLPSVYVIKPYSNDEIKSLVKNGPTYTIQVIDKSTNEVVKTFDNVVYDWQGMTGWNGQVVAEDYTFITKDIKQYVVKSNKYTVKVIK
jgi:hypothetical protein